MIYFICWVHDFIILLHFSFFCFNRTGSLSLVMVLILISRWQEKLSSPTQGPQQLKTTMASVK